MKLKTNYNHTLAASYVGYITQAIVNNLAPLLFLTFQRFYGISYDKIALLVTVNFGFQLLIDLLSAKFIDKIGYRRAIVAAHLFAAAGLAGLGVLPELFADPFYGLLLAIFLYGIGGGLIEVLISPIVEACPTTKRKSAAMSLLHSFYCWGQVFVVLASTAYFVLCGIENWHLLAFLWALIPLANSLYFSQVPIARLVGENAGMSITSLLKNKVFWIFALLMVCAGASELAMSQWASAFAEAGLKVSKTVGDLAGPCLFAVLMGSSRLLYSRLSHRISLKRMMLLSGGLCVLCYLLAVFSPYPLFSLIGCGLCGFSVGILWPGTFSLSAASCPTGGTAMFALLALFGDLGCASGPGLVGLVSGAFGDNLKAGLLSALIFPLLLILGVALCHRHTAPEAEQSRS